MLMTAPQFFDSIRTKRITLIGMGVTNFPCIELFLQKGLDVTVLDRAEASEQTQSGEALKKQGAHFICGDEYLQHLSEFDIILRSPGVSFARQELQDARRRGCVVTSEMELFFDLCPCKIIAVTGSDGKTTTTTIISEILKRQGYTVHLGGNIGRALLPEVERMSPTDLAVVELSSFQLLSMRRSPDIAVLTNIAPNHLDVHKTMEEYVFAKQNILRHQNAFGQAVLNLDSELSNQQETLARGMVKKFSQKKRVTDGAYYDHKDEKLYLARQKEAQAVVSRSEIRIPGMHNVENFLAAFAATQDLAEISCMREVAKSFSGVAHRIEFVREVDGVRWYNDSIATSPTRTIAGLRSFEQKLILIAGGYDKQIPYAPLAPELMEKTRALILMGDTAKKIKEALDTYRKDTAEEPEVFFADSMEQAVYTARKIAKRGDIVSLSPASASFDLYPNFEARGNHFKELVNRLTEGGEP